MSEDLIINRSIIKEITIPGDLDEVWNAWTTKEGIQSFFAPECHVEPHRMFSFTWDAPTTIPLVRKQE